MKTRHSITGLIAFMAIFLASCSEQQPDMGAEVNGTQTLTFNLTTDGQAQTRADAPTVPGYKLEYFLQVLDADGNPQSSLTQNNETGTFEVELSIGVAYTCLFWADYIPTDGDTNEFFNTTDLKAVTLKKYLTSGDQCQAFCATAAVTADEATTTHAVTLKRAVAQVNIRSNEKMTGYSKLTASYTNVPNTFNVSDNTVASTGSVTGPSEFEVTDFSASADTDGKFTYQSAYFLTSADGDGSMLGLTIKTFNSPTATTPIQTITVSYVPTKSNFKTNVVTSFDSPGTAHTYTLNFEDWGSEGTTFDPAITSIWNGVIPAANSSATFGDPSKNGSSEENAYVIASAADLAQLAANVNAGTPYTNKYFKQTINIDLNNRAWKAIGRMNSNPFSGHYDGDGHTITKLSANESAIDAYTGLFGVVRGDDVSLKNIHVSGALEAAYTTGGICAYFVGTNDISSPTGDPQIISGCSFTGTINASDTSAGICASARKAIITSCANYGNVTINSVSSWAGGILGNNNTTGGCIIAGCYNAGNIRSTNNYNTSTASTSGIGGGNYIKIVGCYNIGNVTNVIATNYDISVAPTNDAATACYTKELMNSTTTSAGVTKFDASWITTSGTWAVVAACDGSYSYSSSSNAFTNCKFWKSIGSWNDGTPTYPKLWWEK